MRCNYISFGKVKIPDTSITKCCQESGVTGTLIYCWWECKMAYSLWNSLLPDKFFYKSKTALENKVY